MAAASVFKCFYFMECLASPQLVCCSWWWPFCHHLFWVLSLYESRRSVFGVVEFCEGIFHVVFACLALYCVVVPRCSTLQHLSPCRPFGFAQSTLPPFIPPPLRPPPACAPPYLLPWTCVASPLPFSAILSCACQAMASTLMCVHESSVCLLIPQLSCCASSPLEVFSVCTNAALVASRTFAFYDSSCRLSSPSS